LGITEDRAISTKELGLHHVFFTLTLQKSRMPQIQGVKGEAVISYREPLTTEEMRYLRLSRRVKNMANFFDDLDFTLD